MEYLQNTLPLYIGNWYMWQWSPDAIWRTPFPAWHGRYPIGVVTPRVRQAILGTPQTIAAQNTATTQTQQAAPVVFPTVQRVIDTLQYVTNQDFGFTATQVDQIVLQGVAAPTRRTYLAIQNNDSAGNIMYIRYGGAASIGTGYRVQAGETHFPPGGIIPQNDVHIVVGTAAGAGDGAGWMIYANKQDTDV